MWDLCGQTAKLIDRPLDLVVRLSALRLVQFHRRAGETPTGPPSNRHHDIQIAIDFHHGRRGRFRRMLPLRLQKQLRLIQKPLTHPRGCGTPGSI